MLPINADIAPMEAQSTDTLPQGGDWQYEPKWDGFRCLAFRDHDNLEMRSKSGQPLHRYFPELVSALKALPPASFVLDGEIVIEQGPNFSFDSLLERIHPAQSRINKLALETPATLIVFDLLVDEHGRDLTGMPLQQRRQALERFASRYLSGSPSIVLSPAVTDYQAASKWWHMVGEGLDGIVAKRLGLSYQSGNRKGMLKVKQLRTADCVVGGFRYAEKAAVVGSLLLGLYDEHNRLNHVGFTSSFTADMRRELLSVVEPLIGGQGFDGDQPGGPSRWSNKRSTEWVPLEPVLVVEVQYDHFTDRFRHGTKFLRWRPDKKPQQCTYDQVSNGATRRRAH